MQIFFRRPLRVYGAAFFVPARCIAAIGRTPTARARRGAGKMSPDGRIKGPPANENGEGFGDQGRLRAGQRGFPSGEHLGRAARPGRGGSPRPGNERSETLGGSSRPAVEVPRWPADAQVTKGWVRS